MASIWQVVFRLLGFGRGEMLAMFLLHKKNDLFQGTPVGWMSGKFRPLPLARVLLRKFSRNSDTPRVRVRVLLSKLRVQQPQKTPIETMRLRFMKATNPNLAFRAYAAERALMPLSSLPFILAPLTSLP